MEKLGRKTGDRELPRGQRLGWKFWPKCLSMLPRPLDWVAMPRSTGVGVSLPFQLELPESQAGGWGSTEGLALGNVVEEQVNYLKDTVSRGIWATRPSG